MSLLHTRREVPLRLLGYQSSPELVAQRERRYGRMNREADYGKLNAPASAPINTRLIAGH